MVVCFDIASAAILADWLKAAKAADIQFRISSLDGGLAWRIMVTM